MASSDPDGATPLDEDELGGLVPSHFRTRADLNAWEQRNILDAQLWAGRTRKPALDEQTLRELHRRMFDDTWEWAGRYRTSTKNIGVEPARISVEVRNLLADGQHWLEHETYPLVQSALRLHHRLVKIHPFPNGNGRHARLWCDLLLRQHGGRPPDWAESRLTAGGDIRSAYIAALRAADAQDYAPLFDLYIPSPG